MACFAFGHVQCSFNFCGTSNVFTWLTIIYNRLHDITLLKTVIHNFCTCLWETIRLNSRMRQAVLNERDCYYLVMSFCIVKTISITEKSDFTTLLQMSRDKVLYSSVIVLEPQNFFHVTTEGGDAMLPLVWAVQISVLLFVTIDHHYLVQAISVCF